MVFLLNLRSVPKYCGRTPSFLKKYAYSHPIPSIQCWESVKIVWNCSDGYLVHLVGLKLEKINIETGRRGFILQFLWVIVWKSKKKKKKLTDIYLSRCFQTFLNKLTNKLHTFHTASTGSPNLKRGVIFWFYILALSYNA